MKRVEAVPALVDGREGYDIRVNDPEANVQDYIDAVNLFISENKYFRSRMPELHTCFGCDLCCRERIPVTVVDAYLLADTSIEQVMKDLLHVYVEGPVVDITMRLDESGGCLCLDSAKRICRLYRRRPLVCQTFICCPSTVKARRLREQIVNAGEDELVRTWFGIRGKNGLIIHEAESPDPDIIDYPRTPFFGAKTYSEVKLKEICLPDLWEKLLITTRQEKNNYKEKRRKKKVIRKNCRKK